jgi:hypothetical protein
MIGRGVATVAADTIVKAAVIEINLGPAGGIMTA